MTAAATAAGYLLATKRIKPQVMCRECMELVREGLEDVHAMLAHPLKEISGNQNG